MVTSEPDLHGFVLVVRFTILLGSVSAYTRIRRRMSKAGRDKGHLSHRPSSQVLHLRTPCRWITAHSVKIVHFASAVSMATDGVAQALLLTLPRRRAMRSGQGNGKGCHASVIAAFDAAQPQGGPGPPSQWFLYSAKAIAKQLRVRRLTPPTR